MVKNKCFISGHGLRMAWTNLLLAVLLISTQNSLGQATRIKAFSLTGQLPPSHGKYVYLLDQQNKRVDSATVKVNQFNLTGKIAEPTLYYLQIDTLEKTYPVFLQAAPMRVVIRANGTYQLQGSTTHSQWAHYTAHTDQIREQLIRLYEQRNKAKQQGDSLLYNRLMKRNDSVSILQGAYLLEHIVQKPYTYFNVYLLKEINMVDAYKLNMLNEFRPQLAHYPTFRSLDEAIKQRASLRQKIAVGQSAYAFSLPDSNGVHHDLTSLRRTNKLLLVDFWASWCAPCLKELPGLKALSQQYASEGLLIIGISIDSDSKQWQKALSKHRPAGLQLLSGSKSPLLDKYVISGVPQIFLIDQEGTIQAHDLSGHALQQKVADLLSKAH